PETQQSGRVELYQAERFPYEWRLTAVLLDDVHAADSTLVEIDNVWWLFANVSAKGSRLVDELHIFYANCLSGPWKAHPMNPVKLDVRSSRPAGRIVSWNGAYYRPAQDCSGRYGYAISINRITQLSTERYSETEVGKILPTWTRGL